MPDESKPKSRRGGARPGAGAPRKEQSSQGERFTFYLPQDFSLLLRDIAERAGVTPYEWCKQQILNVLKKEKGS